MTAVPAHPALPRTSMGPLATIWWGMLLLVTIETTVFASLILSYFYLRAGSPVWPLGGIERPSLLLPTVSAVALVLSALAMAWGNLGIRVGDTRRLLTGQGLGMTLLGLVLVLKAVEYAGYDYDWRANAYGSLVWTINGLHVAHLITLFLASFGMWILAWRGFFSERRFIGVQAVAIYWYFVAAVWLPVYATMYLSPYLL